MHSSNPTFVGCMATSQAERRAAVGGTKHSGKGGSCRQALTSASAQHQGCTEQFVPFVVSGYSLTAESNTQELLEDKRKAAVCLSLPSLPPPPPNTPHPYPLLSTQVPTATRPNPVSFTFTILSLPPPPLFPEFFYIYMYFRRVVVVVLMVSRFNE